MYSFNAKLLARRRLNWLFDSQVTVCFKYMLTRARRSMIEMTTFRQSPAPLMGATNAVPAITPALLPTAG